MACKFISTNKNKDSGSAKTKVCVDATNLSDKKMYKTVTICGKNVMAVLDSESDLHLIRSELYERLDVPELDRVSILFYGIGSINNQTLE